MEKISIKNIIVWIVAVVGAIGVFLPWAGTPFASANGWTFFGGVTTALFVEVAVLEFVSLKYDYDLPLKLSVSISGAIAAAFAVAVIVSVMDSSSNVASPQIGFWIVLLCGIGIAALPWIPFKNKQNTNRMAAANQFSTQGFAPQNSPIQNAPTQGLPGQGMNAQIPPMQAGPDQGYGAQNAQAQGFPGQNPPMQNS